MNATTFPLRPSFVLNRETECFHLQAKLTNTAIGFGFAILRAPTVSRNH